MPRYFATFSAGFDALAARALRTQIPDAGGIRTIGGAVIFDSKETQDLIRRIDFFKNSFFLIGEFPNMPSMESLALSSAKISGKISAPKLARTFGLCIMRDNEPISMDGSVKAKLVDVIARKTKLRYRVGIADVEFQLSLRRDSAGYFMQKITSPRAAADGELDGHVAALLCLATNPNEDDAFLDPFAGRGTIPMARARIAGFRGIFAIDNDLCLASALKSKIKSSHNSKIQKSFFAKHGDFLANNFDDGFFDAIATDPPWGLYQKVADDFYVRMMAEFARISRWHLAWQ